MYIVAKFFARILHNLLIFWFSFLLMSIWLWLLLKLGIVDTAERLAGDFPPNEDLIAG